MIASVLLRIVLALVGAGTIGLALVFSGYFSQSPMAIDSADSILLFFGGISILVAIINSWGGRLRLWACSALLAICAALSGWQMDIVSIVAVVIIVSVAMYLLRAKFSVASQK